MRYQQNQAGRRIALVILGTPQWPVVKLHLKKIGRRRNRLHARELHGSEI